MFLAGSPPLPKILRGDGKKERTSRGGGGNEGQLIAGERWEGLSLSRTEEKHYKKTI